MALAVFGLLASDVPVPRPYTVISQQDTPRAQSRRTRLFQDVPHEKAYNRFGHRLLVVVNPGQHRVAYVIKRGEADPFEQHAEQKTQPNFEPFSSRTHA